jgi:predicted nucleic acid-binding protein
VDATALFALARSTALSSYDAAYLWLANELSAPLATFDRHLGTAAKTLFRGDG